jgi:hypothetical protein
VKSQITAPEALTGSTGSINSSARLILSISLCRRSLRQHGVGVMEWCWVTIFDNMVEICESVSFG